MTIIMLPSFLLTMALANTPVPDPAASEAVTVCQQFVQVRLGKAEQPEEIKAQPVPKRVGEWLIDGKVKGPEGPLLFACLLRQGLRWELINFSLWAPQAIKAV